MDSAIPMLLFFGGLTFFGLLIIWATYQSRELERAEEEIAHPAAPGLDGPHFFAATAPEQLAAAAPDPELLARLEEFLAEQQGRARDFVDYPTVEMLFRRLEGEVFPRLIDRIEDFLRAERIAAGDFLTNPSIESLHRRGPRILAA